LPLHSQMLARRSSSIILNVPAPAEEIVGKIKTTGGTAIALGADVSKEDEVVAMFRDTVAQFGTVDILVANAGLQRDSPFARMSLANWQFVLNVNLTGQFLCAREATREFLRRGPDPSRSLATGKIICISSVQQVIPWAGHCNYATSKGGIKLFMESIAQELAPHKIRVNAIGPGQSRHPSIEWPGRRRLRRRRCARSFHMTVSECLKTSQKQLFGWFRMSRIMLPGRRSSSMAA
jgi:glucose 1-dehydrogenase